LSATKAVVLISSSNNAFDLSGLETLKFEQQSNSLILKANLSWTRKKSNSNDGKKFSFGFISFLFALKARFQVLKFEFCRIYHR